MGLSRGPYSGAGYLKGSWPTAQRCRDTAHNLPIANRYV